MPGPTTPNQPAPPKCPPSPHIRITPSAEKDFEELPCPEQRKVLETLKSPLRPDKTKRLGAQGRTRLRRVRVNDLRIVIANRRDEHTDYIWRIHDRKDIYEILDNLDPRIPFTGISIEEFLMKHNDLKDSPQTLIPPGSSPTAA